MGYVFDAMNRDREATPKPAAAPPPPPSRAAEAADARAPLPETNRPARPDREPNLEGVDDRLVALTERSSSMAEEYRGIRTGLLAHWEQARHLVYTITSATPQEGKTITSLNLGVSFSEVRTRRTIVLEADLRLPQFQKLLGLDDGPGVVALLEGRTGLADATHSLDTGLDVICAGERAGNRSMQLLSGTRMSDLVQTLRHKYDHVIIDTPPVVELADAGIIGAMSDGVLLIVRMNRTPRPLIEQAIRTLNNYKAPVAGLLATDHPRNRRRYYYYRYGYRYQYSYYKQAA